MEEGRYGGAVRGSFQVESSSGLTFGNESREAKIRSVFFLKGKPIFIFREG